MISVTESVDSANENDDLIIGFKQIVNDLYCKDISRKVTAGVRQKQKDRGLVETLPMGYYKDKNTGIVHIDEEAAEIIREIFNQYIEGYGMTIIARRLNERGIKSPEFYMRRRIADWKPKLSKRYLWVASAIKRILNNELYIGTMVNHKTASNKIRKTKTFIPPKQQFRHPNFCQPIIEQGIWDQVQFLSAQRAATRPRASGGRNIHRYPGIIKCAECGASLIARTRRWRGTEYVEYVCNSNHRYGKSYCTPHVVRESKLDEMVVSHIRSLQDRILSEAEKYDGIVKEWGRKKPQYEKKIEDYESKLEKLNREIENLIIDRINDRPHAELYTKMIEDREKQIDNINQQISDCKEYDCVSRQKHKNFCETSKVIEEILKNGHISDAHIRMLVKQVNVHQNEDKSIDVSFEMNGDWEGSKAIYVDSRA